MVFAVASLAFQTFLEQALGVTGGVAAFFTFFAVLYGFMAIWDFAAAAGLFLRQPWGWWITMVGLLYAAVDRLAELAITYVILPAEDGPGLRLGQYGAIVFGSLTLAYKLNSDKALKMFNVQGNEVVRRIVVFGLAVTLALGVNAGRYVVSKQAEEAAAEMEKAAAEAASSEEEAGSETTESAPGPSE